MCEIGGLWILKGNEIHHNDDGLEKEKDDGKEAVGRYEQVGAVGMQVDYEEGDKLWKQSGV